MQRFFPITQVLSCFSGRKDEEMTPELCLVFLVVWCVCNYGVTDYLVNCVEYVCTFYGVPGSPRTPGSPLLAGSPVFPQVLGLGLNKRQSLCPYT